MEEWKDIQGYEGKYQVSSCGRVKTLNYKRTGQERIMKQRANNKGYKYVNLCNNGKMKSYLVHRLVATAFIDNPNNYPCVNHKDEQSYNNFVENLEFCTYEYNNNYGTVKERKSKSMVGKTCTEETKRKMSRSHIGLKCTNKTKRKLSESMRGENNPKARKVQCINTGEIFNTISEAAKWCNTDIGNITKQIKAIKRKTAGKHPVTKEKLQWKYID